MIAARAAGHRYWKKKKHLFGSDIDMIYNQLRCMKSLVDS